MDVTPASSNRARIRAVPVRDSESQVPQRNERLDAKRGRDDPVAVSERDPTALDFVRERVL